MIRARNHHVMALLSAFVGLTLAAPAFALVVNSSGQVTDWNNIQPFTQPNGTSIANGVYSFRENNTSSINFSSGGPYVPSGGETYDLEEVHVRNNGNQVQMLLVSSNFPTAGGFNIGDFLLSTDGDAAWEMGLVTRNHDGLIAGQLYDNITTAGMQAGSGSNAGNAYVINQIGNGGAVFVNNGTAIGGTSPVLTAVKSYGTVAGQNENNTVFTEYTFTVPTAVDGFNFQLAWGCGNDVIDGYYIMDRPPTPPTNAVPEMATAMLSLMGLMSLGLKRRR